MFSKLGNILDASVISESGMYKLVHFKGSHGSMLKMTAGKFGGVEYVFNKYVDDEKIAKIISFFKFVAGTENYVSVVQQVNFIKLMNKVSKELKHA